MLFWGLGSRKVLVSSVLFRVIFRGFVRGLSGGVTFVCFFVVFGLEVRVWAIDRCLWKEFYSNYLEGLGLVVFGFYGYVGIL